MSYYPQQYVVAPSAGGAQQYAAPQPQQYAAPAYDPNAYAAPVPVQQYAAPAPQYSPQPSYPSYGNRDDPRTIFVTGFPVDIRERELVNMCRFMQGYEAASMKASSHGAPQGFVLFQYTQAAHQAVQMISGMDFGEGCFLRAEMARKNMYIKSGVDERAPKAYRTDAGPAAAPSYGAPQGGPPGGSYTDRNNDNPPCNTLFIGNLSTSVSDAEIEAYFRNLKGDMFTTCKVNRNQNRVSAFVQFNDIATAQDVHTTQQAKELPGSDRGPMRIQFSKNPLGEFGKRRREAESYHLAMQAQNGGAPADPNAVYATQGMPASSPGMPVAAAVAPGQDVALAQQAAPVTPAFPTGQ